MISSLQAKGLVKVTMYICQYFCAYDSFFNVFVMCTHDKDLLIILTATVVDTYCQVWINAIFPNIL